MSRPDLDVMLCRDCCCGTTRKHPGVDHAAQRDALEACEDVPGVRVRVVDCLDECDRSNVVLVRDFAAMRTGTARRPIDTWFGGVLTERLTDELVCWIRERGEIPARLRNQVFKGKRG